MTWNEKVHHRKSPIFSGRNVSFGTAPLECDFFSISPRSIIRIPFLMAISIKNSFWPPPCRRRSYFRTRERVLKLHGVCAMSKKKYVQLMRMVNNEIRSRTVEDPRSWAGEFRIGWGLHWNVETLEVWEYYGEGYFQYHFFNGFRSIKVYLLIVLFIDWFYDSKRVLIRLCWWKKWCS